jgi:hypothetical protein
MSGKKDPEESLMKRHIMSIYLCSYLIPFDQSVWRSGPDDRFHSETMRAVSHFPQEGRKSRKV